MILKTSRESSEKATSPERTAKELEDPYIAKSGKYEPSILETASLGANTVLGNTNALYRILTTYLPELRGTVAPQEVQLPDGRVIKGLPQMYDTNPTVVNPNAYVRTLPTEMIGKWFGIQPRTAYKKYTGSNKSRIKEQRKIQKKNVNKNIEK